ncbi:MAG: hypothetical protein ACE5KQ_00610 [Thermoplasmata archaeon]
MELVYLKSPTGQQHERAEAVLAHIRAVMPDLEYREVDPRKDPDYAGQFPISHAPGLIIDGVIEYVGIPRERMLLDRLHQLESLKKGKGSSTASKEGDKAP